MCRKSDYNELNCDPDLFVTYADSGFHNYKNILNLTSSNESRVRTSFDKVTFPLDSILATDISKSTNRAYAAMMSFSFNKTTDPQVRSIRNQWMSAFIHIMDHWPSASTIKATWWAWPQAKQDLDGFRTGLAHLMWPLCLVLVVVSMLSGSVADWVYSKPLLALVPILSSCMALATGFGFGQMCQVQLPSLAYLVPFTLICKQKICSSEW